MEGSVARGEEIVPVPEAEQEAAAQERSKQFDGVVDEHAISDKGELEAKIESLKLDEEIANIWSKIDKWNDELQKIEDGLPQMEQQIETLDRVANQAEDQSVRDNILAEKQKISDAVEALKAIRDFRQPRLAKMEEHLFSKEQQRERLLAEARGGANVSDILPEDLTDEEVGDFVEQAFRVVEFTDEENAWFNEDAGKAEQERNILTLINDKERVRKEMVEMTKPINPEEIAAALDKPRSERSWKEWKMVAKHTTKWTTNSEYRKRWQELESAMNNLAEERMILDSRKDEERTPAQRTEDMAAYIDKKSAERSGLRWSKLFRR